MCRVCHCDYSHLENRIHDLEDNGPHTYWTPAEYDHISERLEKETDDEDLVEEVQQGNLFTEFETENISSGNDSDEDEVIEDLNLRGVKSVCPLNSLASFHCVTSFPPDILHDVMEGVIPEDLLSVIRILSKKGWFTLTQYNSALERMDFLSYEKGDQPYPVPTSNKVKKLKGKALSNLGKALKIRTFPFAWHI